MKITVRNRVGVIGGLGALAIAAVVLWWLARPDMPEQVTTDVPSPVAPILAPPAPPAPRPAPPAPDHGMATDDDGTIDGRVINAETGAGVAGAELNLIGDTGALAFTTSSDGTFELTPEAGGSFALTSITAPGFLPYAPAIAEAGPRVTLAPGRAIHGVILRLSPEVDYRGAVLDPRGAPVAGARVRWIGSAHGDRLMEDLAPAWTTDADGRFAFQAAEGAVLEASAGALRGWGRVDHSTKVIRWLTLRLGDAAARPTAITGRVRDPSGAPIASAVVRAVPSVGLSPAAVFALSGTDGAFTLVGLDRGAYDVSAEAERHVRAVRGNVLGGSRGIELVLAAGMPLAGRVVDASGAPVTAYTLRVHRRAGAARVPVAGWQVIDPQGRFALRVADGEYDLAAAAPGHAWIAPEPTRAAAGATDIQLVLGRGASLRGRVLAGDSRTPLPGARVTYQIADPRFGSEVGARSPDATAMTGDDGAFELTDIPAGPIAIQVDRWGYATRIESGLTARDGQQLGPIELELNPLDPGERNATELVGIGIRMIPDGDALRVIRVFAGGGAFDAGLGFGDLVEAIDGAPVASLGIDGAIARIRGLAGTTLVLTLRRDGQDVQVPVERRAMRI